MFSFSSDVLNIGNTVTSGIESLVDSAFERLVATIIGSFLDFISIVCSAITDSILSPFTFATTAQLEDCFPGIGIMMDGMKAVGLAIVIILSLYNCMMYIVRPDQIRESALGILFRGVFAGVLVGYSDYIIDWILALGSSLYDLFVDFRDIASGSFADQVTNIMTLDISDLYGVVQNGIIALSMIGTIFVVILLVIVVWNYIKLWFQLFKRFANFAVQLYMAPLTLCSLGSTTTSSIFFSWCRCMVAQFLLLMLNAWFIKIFLYSLVLGGLNIANNFIIHYLFLLGFLKVAQEAEDMIAKWGLFAMSSANAGPLAELREMGGMYMTAAMLMGGKVNGILGPGGAATASAAASAANKGGLVGGLRNAGILRQNKDGSYSSLLGAKVGPKAYSQASAMASSWKNTKGEPITKRAIAAMEGRKNAPQKDIGEFKKNHPRMYSAAAGAMAGSFAGPVGMVVGAGAGAVSSTFRGDKKWASISPTAAKDLTKSTGTFSARTIEGKAKTAAQRYYDKVTGDGKVARVSSTPTFQDITMPDVNTKRFSAADMQNGENASQLRGAFGDNTYANTKSLGNVTSMSYDPATGTKAAAFEKQDSNGNTVASTIKAYPLSGTNSYQGALDKAIENQTPGATGFYRTQDSDGNEYAVFHTDPGKSGGGIPQELRAQEQEYANDATVRVNNAEVTEALRQELRDYNSAYINNPSHMSDFCNIAEGNIYAGPSSSLKKTDSDEYDALKDFFEKGDGQKYYHGDASPEGLASDYKEMIEGKAKQAPPEGDKGLKKMNSEEMNDELKSKRGF